MNLIGLDEGVPLDSLKELGEVVEILPERLWVVEKIGEGGYDELHFVTFNSQEIHPSKGPIMVDSLFLIQGFSETLREGRHTYFPEDGYVFYMDMENMIAAIQYCTIYFDMD